MTGTTFLRDRVSMMPLVVLSILLLGVLPEFAAGGIAAPTPSRFHGELIQKRNATARFNEAMQKGQQSLQEGKVQDAIAHFKEAVAIDPRSPEAHMFLGFAYRVGGSYELLGEAKAELRQALAIDPNLVWARIYLGRIYLDLGRIRNARQELERTVQQHPSMPQALALLGEIYRQEEDLERALKTVERSRELAPELIDGHYYLGLVYRDLGRLEEAESELEVAADSAQANPDIFLGLADVYAKQDRHEEAARSLQKGLSMDSSRPDLHMELVTAYRKTGKKKEAAEQLEWLYSNESRFLGTPYFEELRARMRFEDGILAQLENDRKRAISRLHEALEFAPAHGEAHRLLAVLYYEEKSFARAREHAENARTAGHPVDEQFFQKLVEQVDGQP